MKHYIDICSYFNTAISKWSLLTGSAVNRQWSLTTSHWSLTTSHKTTGHRPMACGYFDWFCDPWRVIECESSPTPRTSFLQCMKPPTSLLHPSVLPLFLLSFFSPSLRSSPSCLLASVSQCQHSLPSPQRCGIFCKGQYSLFLPFFFFSLHMSSSFLIPTSTQS